MFADFSDLGGSLWPQFSSCMIRLIALLEHRFSLGGSLTLFERWRRIFGHFLRSSLPIARYWRLIHVKNASKSASTIISNPNGKSVLKTGSTVTCGFHSPPCTLTSKKTSTVWLTICISVLVNFSARYEYRVQS